MKNVVVIIMAGGLGKRMNSNVPKVLHKVGGIPMLCHILFELNNLSNLVTINKILLVVGKYKEIIKEELDKYDTFPNIEFIYQDEPLGTGHAIQCCRNELLKYPESDVLILSGDVPMLKTNTMYSLLDINNEVKMITTILKEPNGYGRIVEKYEKFEKIIEQNDCNKSELKINKVNCGIYVIKAYNLSKYLPYLNNNNSQSEYYLTDIIEIIKREENLEVGMLNIPEERVIEIIGVNTIEQLRELDKLIKIK
jgi:UDP-N-acetylglucosamine diphosphorylase/glucosamine-1-phosphate N-acetyltransferase